LSGGTVLYPRRDQKNIKKGSWAQTPIWGGFPGCLNARASSRDKTRKGQSRRKGVKTTSVGRPAHEGKRGEGKKKGTGAKKPRSIYQRTTGKRKRGGISYLQFRRMLTLGGEKVGGKKARKKKKRGLSRTGKGQRVVD